MIEITNRTKGPIQLVVRTGSEAKLGNNMTVLNIPGIGSGNNVRIIEDERHTHWIDNAEKAGQITQRKITRK